MRSDFLRERRPSLLRRIRWDNVARAGAILLTVVLAVAWTRGGDPPPALPPDPVAPTVAPAPPPAQPDAGIAPARPRREDGERRRADRARRAARAQERRRQRWRERRARGEAVRPAPRRRGRGDRARARDRGGRPAAGGTSRAPGLDARAPAVAVPPAPSGPSGGGEFGFE